MTSRKSFLTKQNLIFPATSNTHFDKKEEGVFEFDEAELWNPCSPTKRGANSISGLKRASRKVDGRVGPMGPASLPVNIPKILKEEHKGYKKWESDDDDDDDERHQYGGIKVPPHEYLARTRSASLSVHEGIGRTLKGRDLCSVRNAIWKKVGFED